MHKNKLYVKTYTSIPVVKTNAKLYYLYYLIPLEPLLQKLSFELSTYFMFCKIFPVPWRPISGHLSEGHCFGDT